MSAGALDRAISQPGPRTGRILADKYRLLGKLGEGGMGEVYAAEHTFVGRRFAVKFLRPELARDEQIMSRFRREAQAAGSLESENVVAVTDFGHADDGAPFMVMEYLVGEDMRSLLVRTGRLPVKRAVELALQTCRGLYAAHARSIVHRDLKPENLFVSKRGDGNDLLKILDFGIAKLRAVPASRASTQVGAVIGTLLYMPPEQLRGEKDTDHRADIYALGAILYEALSGSVPHPGDEAQGIMFHILYKEPARLCSLRPDVPAELAAVVHRALAADAGDRFASVVALSEALAPFSGRQVTPLDSTANQTKKTLPDAPSDGGHSEPAQTISETHRALQDAGLSSRLARQRALLWSLLVLALLACGAFALLAPRDTATAPHVVSPLVAPKRPSAGPSTTAPSAPATPTPVADKNGAQAARSNGQALGSAPLSAPTAASPRNEPPPEAPSRKPHPSRRVPSTATLPIAEPLRVQPAEPPTPPPTPSRSRTRVQLDRDNPYE
jgi:serine/threonine-protein kinase